MNGTICEQMREKNWSFFYILFREGDGRLGVSVVLFTDLFYLKSEKGGGEEGGWNRRNTSSALFTSAQQDRSQAD